MQAIEKNLYQHKNKFFYALWTVNGRTERQSLKTKELKEARRLLKELFRPPSKSAPSVLETPVPQQTQPVSITGTPLVQAVAPALPPVTATVQRPDFLTALRRHVENTAFKSPDTKRNFVLRQRTLLNFCTNWDTFEPISIWTQFANQGSASAPNQLRWFLNSFVTFCNSKGWLDDTFLTAVKKIPLKRVASRKIQVPQPQIISEILKMAEVENKELGSFLRFLACTGLRKTGANSVRWEKVDFSNSQFTAQMKGQESVTFPMIPEAQSLLEERHMKAGRPSSGFVWGFGERALKKAARILKKYAQGMGQNTLTHLHALRHYFASIALSKGLTAGEVAQLLGHKDGGKLVMTVYGHVLQSQLRLKTNGLSMTT
ncbi:MAG: tyrosine-type recombinase/integrase [Verrucomicrobiota bacterium]